MPTPRLMARGNNMGRGPYEKSSILEDTGLHPGKKVEERFDIFFPVEEIETDDGKTAQVAAEREMDVTVQLWYKPFGTMSGAVLWREWQEIISLDKKSKPTTYPSGNPQ
ncbi:hypothetical protein SAMN05661003_101338 [Desulfuromonas thiophila]|uniref:Uncharacterized protein n=3 Tax=Desulfuromonas thiophila TaxID=57664 RepID=A0A1G6XPK9_9BACT|nr:hypothetical protein SAMN05661003_101338 [Desulfuromonas thiophila]